MTREEIRTAVLEALATVAPEADPASLRPDRNLRDQLEIDSMDFLNFIIALHHELHVSIPEADYPKFATLEGCVEYLASRLGPPLGP